MSTVTYRRALRQVQRLTPADQLRLLEELAAIVRRQVTTKTRRSILELQELGKEIWRNINAQEYIDRERALWGQRGFEGQALSGQQSALWKS